MLGGFYLRFGEVPEEASNRRLQALARALLARPHPALTDVIPGYTTLYLEYDARRTSERALRAWLRAQPPTPPSPGRRLEVSVVYDGPDLETVAAQTGLTTAEVRARHSARDYHVYAVGFSPGLAFMGDLDPALQLPRRTAPRPRVAAGSLAIAQGQTTVYPVASPGGWHLLGRSVTPVYTPTAARPLLFEAGDRVRFRAVSAEAAAQSPHGSEEVRDLLPEAPRHPLLQVLEPGLLTLVVDGGRFLAGRYGFARSGPLDTVAAACANRLVGNRAAAPLLELNLQGGLFEVLAAGVLAFAGGGMTPQLNGRQVPAHLSFAVRLGDRLGFRAHPEGSRGYLALAGELDSGRFLESASVDLRGRIGRPLRAGDVLGVATPRAVRPGRSFTPYRRASGSLRLLPGPQASAEALQALTRHTFRVGRADRMGVQLLGGAVPGGEVVSEAVPLGSVQVPPGGVPLLLLHDRGTLGGYHKPAVLHPADLHRAGQLRPGQRVRFSVVG